mgnify:CR=1 FL=1
MSSNPTAAQNRFLTFRTTASATPAAGFTDRTGASAPADASSIPTRNGTNLNARRDDPVERLEDDGLGQRRAAIAEQPPQRDEDLEHGQRVKAQVEREHAPEPLADDRLTDATASVSRTSRQAFAPARTRAATVGPTCRASRETRQRRRRPSPQAPRLSRSLHATRQRHSRGKHDEPDADHRHRRTPRRRGSRPASDATDSRVAR